MDKTGEDWGKLILRVSVAGLLLLHGIGKLTGGIGGVESSLAGSDLPLSLAYGVYIGEIIAPLFVILGPLARIAAGVMAFNMLVAIYLAHSGDVFSLNEGGGSKIELQLLYLLGSIAIALLGPGAIAWQLRRRRHGS